jgi:hypothetical protein
MMRAATDCSASTTHMPFVKAPGRERETRIEYDHKHFGKRVRFYVYADAAMLLADFWTEVEAILQKRSIQS